MNKKLVWVIIGIAVLLSASVAYLLLNKTPMVPATNEQAAPQTTQPANSPAIPSASPGVYQDYTDSSVGSTAGTKILFFHAPWCPQCRQLDAEIRAGALPNGVTIFKTDYDSNQALRQKYGVTLQTTFVSVDDQGNLIKKYVAYDEPTLAALTRSGLW